MREATWIKTDGTSTRVQSRGKAFELDELQKMVGGYIQLVHTSHPRREMYVNEEGLIHDLPVNVAASALIDPKYLTAGGVRGDAVVIEKVADACALCGKPRAEHLKPSSRCRYVAPGAQA